MAMASPAHAIIFIGGVGGGGGGGGGGCTTQSFDVQFTTSNTYSVHSSNQERGQSWVAGVSKSLYAVWLKANDGAWSGANLTIRIGTSSNLSSSYLVQFTCVVPDAAGFFQCVIPASDRPSLTSSTTYYMIFRTDANWNVSRDSAQGYANGTAYYDITLDWSGTSSANDLPFKTEMCD